MTEPQASETTPAEAPPEPTAEAPAPEVPPTTETKAEGEESPPVEKKSTEQAADPIETKAEPEGEPPVERIVPKVEDYTLPEGMPTSFAQFAFDNDMTQEQLDNSLKTFGGYMKAAQQVDKSKMAEEGEKLASSWGSKRQSNLNLLQRALAQNDPEGVLEKELTDSGYGNHPAVLNFLLSIGNSMSEGGFLKGSVNRPPGQKTAAASMFGNSHPSAN